MYSALLRDKKYLLPNKTATEDSKSTINKIEIKTIPLVLEFIINIRFDYPYITFFIFGKFYFY